MHGSPDGNYKSPTLFEIAREYIEAGISVIPLKLDGSKKPPEKFGWKKYQEKLPLLIEALQWFRDGDCGMAVLGGVVSGGLEIFDFDRDAATIFPKWYAMVEPIACRLPIGETPSGGIHLYLRCSVIGRNSPIAKISQAEYEAEKAYNDQHGITAKIRTVMIETRGDGGYVVCCSSPAAVHELNYPYVQVAGPVLPEIPTITPEERLQLWKAARTFDRSGLYEQQLRAAQPRPYRPRLLTGDEKSRFERARKYLSKMEASISGNNGHDKAFRAAAVLVDKFGLSFDAAMQLMHEFNQRCVPPWSDHELRHKVESAIQKASA